MWVHMILYSYKQTTNTIKKVEVQNYERHEQSISRVEAVQSDEEKNLKQRLASFRTLAKNTDRE